MNYKILATIIIILFYVIYYGKLVIQSKKGIKTVKLAKSKDKKVGKTEKLMTFSTVAVLIAQIVSLILDYNVLNIPALTVIGAVIAFIGDIVFLISVITMKDNWRVGIPEDKDTNIVDTGIYSISRNPAFLGFDLMYIGIACMYFNPLTLVFSAFAIYMLHKQIVQEESYLEKTFGKEYISYKNKVNRYLGKRK